MTKFLFIDDERFPPNDGKSWTIVRSSCEAIFHVKKYGLPDMISFDHDLGGDDKSTIFIHWLINYLLDCQDIVNINYRVHSQNPVGAANIEGILDGWNKYVKSVNQ